MKSVRLDPELETKLQRAARALDVSQSEFIRAAVARRCDEVLGDTLAHRVAPLVGTVKSRGGRAAHTGKTFRKLLARKRT